MALLPSGSAWAQGRCPGTRRLASVHPIEKLLPGFFMWGGDWGSRQVAVTPLFATPSRHPSPNLQCSPLLTACWGQLLPSILFLFVPDSQSTLHSWLLGVSGISSYPPSSLGSTLPFAPCSPHALLSYPHDSPLLNTVPSFSQLAVGSCNFRVTDLPLLS